MERYIRFDWAIKKLLRQKANFVVLEGLISTLLEKKIKINRLLESESNQENEYDKQNRVDILAEDEKGAKYIIEVQNSNETAYFQRVLFGTSKLITEYINRGDNYENVVKVYSINIVYFDLGRGDDYVYYGKTEFRGMHTNDVLSLSPFQIKSLGVDNVSDLFPEYYILKVNGFNDAARTPLEEWIDFLKNGRIAENPLASGLREAMEIMKYDAMSREEKKIYDDHINSIVVLKDNIETAKGEGRMEGERIGMEKGALQEKVETIRQVHSMGLPMEQIAKIVRLTEDEVGRIIEDGFKVGGVSRGGLSTLKAN